jgi:hypothetical protein
MNDSEHRVYGHKTYGMKKVVLSVFILVLALGSNAQTRRIAHRAHSGARSEAYDGRDGSYGEIPAPRVRPQSERVVLKTDTVKTKSGSDSIFYFWDTLPDASVPRYNEFRPMPVHRLRDIGTICKPATVSQ